MVARLRARLHRVRVQHEKERLALAQAAPEAAAAAARAAPAAVRLAGVAGHKDGVPRPAADSARELRHPRARRQLREQRGRDRRLDAEPKR